MISATPSFADQQAADSKVAVLRALEAGIEEAKEKFERAAAAPRYPRPEDHRAERGAQRQRIERRQQHRERDREGELPVQRAGKAGHEAGGDEHGRQHQRDAHQAHR